MKNCIFCKIIKGEILAAKVWENDEFLAFLSVSPLNSGHTLVIPKKHIDYIFDLDDDLLGKLLIVSKPIAQSIAKSFPPKTGKIGIMVAGLEVPHAHLHLVPMDSERDLDFTRAKNNIPIAELVQQAEKIATYLK